MAVINYTIHDKIPSVSQRSLSVFQALLAKHAKLKVTRKAEFGEHIDSICSGVMEKLGDNNIRVKETAEEVMM